MGLEFVIRVHLEKVKSRRIIANVELQMLNVVCYCYFFSQCVEDVYRNFITCI